MSEKCNKNVVLVWDSGVGGLSVLKSLLHSLGGVKFVYYADVDNAPYGNKSVEELREKVLSKFDDAIRKYKPDCVVLACNTITACLVDDIRDKYKNIKIVGTEPAIKPAIREGKDILLMMTPTTFRHCELVGILRGSSINTYWVLDEDLALFIQNNFENREYIARYLNRYLSKYKDKKLSVVLGCTHYVLIKDIIGEILGKKVKILDSTIGVTNRVKQLLDVQSCGLNECEIVGDKVVGEIWSALRGSELCVE